MEGSSLYKYLSTTGQSAEWIHTYLHYSYYKESLFWVALYDHTVHTRVVDSKFWIIVVWKSVGLESSNPNLPLLLLNDVVPRRELCSPRSKTDPKSVQLCFQEETDAHGLSFSSSHSACCCCLKHFSAFGRELLRLTCRYLCQHGLGSFLRGPASSVDVHVNFFKRKANFSTTSETFLFLLKESKHGSSSSLKFSRVKVISLHIHSDEGVELFDRFGASKVAREIKERSIKDKQEERKWASESKSWFQREKLRLTVNFKIEINLRFFYHLRLCSLLRTLALVVTVCNKAIAIITSQLRESSSWNRGSSTNLQRLFTFCKLCKVSHLSRQGWVGKRKGKYIGFLVSPALPPSSSSPLVKVGTDETKLAKAQQLLKWG